MCEYALGGIKCQRGIVRDQRSFHRIGRKLNVCVKPIPIVVARDSSRWMVVVEIRINACRIYPKRFPEVDKSDSLVNLGQYGLPTSTFNCSTCLDLCPLSGGVSSYFNAFVCCGSRAKELVCSAQTNLPNFQSEKRTKLISPRIINH